MSTTAEDRSPGQALCTSSGTPHAAMCVLRPGGVTARAINGVPWVMATGVELVIVNGVII